MRGSKGGSIVILIVLILALLAFMVFFSKNSQDENIGVNVTTGKLQVDIVDEKDKSLIGDILDFVNPKGSGKLYFEPGATNYTQGFQVKNTGNIPIDYRVYISETEGVDKAALEEAFEFWITTDPTNLETAEKLMSFMGSLEVGQESEIYYLIVRMKESAGNEFQDKTYTGIGITVYAVQSEVDGE